MTIDVKSIRLDPVEGEQNAFKVKCGGIESDITIQVEKEGFEYSPKESKKVEELVLVLAAEFFKSIQSEQLKTKHYKPAVLSVVVRSEGIFDKSNIATKILPKSLNTSSEYAHFKEAFKTVFKTAFEEIKASKETVAPKKKVTGIQIRGEETSVARVQLTAQESLRSKVAEIERESVRRDHGESYYTEEPSIDAAFFAKNRWQKEVDRKEFAHIHGDLFLEHTGLEGLSSKAAMKYNRAIVNQRLLHDPHFSPEGKKKLASLSKQMDVGIELYRKMARIDEKQSDADVKSKINDFCKSFAKEVNNLQVGESFLFIGGWTGIPFGHAIYFQITKDSPTHVSLKVFNKGEGIQYHPAVLIGEELQYQVHLNFTDIPIENIASKAFSQAIAEMQTILSSRNPNQCEYTEFRSRDIYEHLLPFLGGKEVPFNLSSTSNFEKFSLPQHSGICAWASLDAVMQDSLPAKDYSRWKHEVELQSIIDLFAVNQDVGQLRNDEQLCLLIKKSVEQLDRAALDRYKQKIISRKELEIINEIVRTISSRVSEALRLREEQAYVVEAPNVILVSTPQIAYGSIDPKKPFQSEIMATNLPGHVASLGEALKVPTINLETIQKDLSDFYNVCLKLQKEGKSKEVVLAINELFANLPMPAHGFDFWSGIKKEQIQNCMALFSNLSELLFTANTSWNHEGFPLQHKENTIHQFKILAIQHRLAALSGALGNDFKNWKLPAVQFMEAYYGSGKGDKNIYDARLRKECYELMNYLKTGSEPIFEEVYKKPVVISADISNSTENKFILSHLEKPQALQRFKEAFPNCKHEKLKHVRLAFALTDLQGRFLPPEFCFLKKQAFLAKNTLLSKTSKLVDLQVHVTEQKGNVPLFTVENDNSGLAENNNPFPKEEQETLLFYHLREPANNPVTFVLDGPDHRYKDIQNENAFTKRGMSVDELRDLFSLVSRGNNDLSKNYPSELQVEKLISYFSTNLLSLDSKDHQVLFKEILFSKDYVAKCLRANPEYATEIGAFLIKAYDYLKMHQKINGMTFLLYISELLQDSFELLAIEKNVHPKIKEGLETIASKFCPREKLEDLYKTSEDYQRAFVYQVYLHHYSKKKTAFTPVELDQVLYMLAFLKVSSPPSRNFHMEQEIAKFTLRIIPEITNSLKSTPRKEVLDLIHKTLIADGVENIVWDLTKLPLCIGNNGDYSFSLADLSVYYKNQKFFQIPFDLKSFSYGDKIISVFSKQVPPQVISPAEGVYEFVDPFGIPTRFIKQEKSVYIQKQINKDGKWFQYVSDTDYILSGVLKKQVHWISCEDSKTILITKKENYEITHKVSITDNNTFHVSPIQNPSLRLLNVKTLDKKFWKGKEHIYSFLGNIENPQSIHIWVDSQGKPQEIEYPRLNLKFHIKEKHGVLRAECAQIPGFFIAPQQRVKKLGDFENFLLLENEQGDKKVIMPKNEIKLEEKGSLSTKVYIPPQYEGDENWSYYQYDINKQGELSSQSIESNLFLALLYFSKKEYEKAQQYLRQESQKLTSYNIYEEQILQWLCSSYSESQNIDPKAIAVYLTARAQGLINKHNTENLRSYFSDDPSILSAYSKYLDTREHATTLFLYPEEERAILKEIIEIINDPVRLRNAERITFVLSEADAIKIRRRLAVLEGRIEYSLISKIPKKAASNAYAEFQEGTSYTEQGLQNVLLKTIADSKPATFLQLLTCPEYAIDYRDIYEKVKNPNAKERRDFVLGLKMGMYRIYHRYVDLAFYFAVSEAPDKFPSYHDFKRIVEDKSEKGDKEFTEKIYKPFQKYYILPRQNSKNLQKVTVQQDSLIAVAVSKKTEALIPHNKVHIAEVLTPVLSEVLKRHGRPISSFGRIFELGKNAAAELVTKESTDALQHLMIKSGAQGLEASEGKAFSEEINSLKEISSKLRHLETSIVKLLNEKQSMTKGLKFEQLYDMFLSGTLTTELPKKITNMKSEDLDQLEKWMTDYLVTLSDAGVPNQFVPKHASSKILMTEDLNILKRDLIIQKVEVSKLKIQLEQRLLNLANKEISEEQGIIQKAQVGGTIKKKLSILDLFSLFLKGGKHADFKNFNPNITPEEVEQLRKLTTDFLIRGSEEQALDRSLKALENLENYLKVDSDQQILAIANRNLSKDVFDVRGLTTVLQKGFEALQKINPNLTKTDFDELQKLVSLRGTKDPTMKELSNELAKELLTARAYDPSKQMTFLIFEFCSGMMLRRDQVKNIDKMLTGKELVLQSIMGSGKSSVWSPILAQIFADGEHLTTIVVPKPLFETLSKDMQISSRTNFQQKVHVMPFDRKTEFTVEKLKDIYERLKIIKTNPSVVLSGDDLLLMTPESIKCLALKFQEALFMFLSNKDKRIECGQKITMLQQILELYKKGHVVVDEADTILNSRLELNYTLGDPEALNPNRYELAHDIFHTILNNPEIAKKMNLGMLPTWVPSNKANPFIESNYHAEIKPLIVDDFLLKAKLKSNELGKYLKSLNPKEWTEIRKYLLSEKDADTSFFVTITDKEVKNLLALLKEQLNTILPLTLNKKCFVDFGPAIVYTPKTIKLVDGSEQKEFVINPLAIPYKGNNNPEHESQFGNPYELINYTLQTYLKQGVRWHHIKHIVEKLQKEFVKEQALNPYLPESETSSMQAFSWLCGKDTNISLVNCTDSQVSKITENLNLISKEKFPVDQIKKMITDLQNVEKEFPKTISGVKAELLEHKKGPDALKFNPAETAPYKEFVKFFGMESQGMNLVDLTPPDNLTKVEKNAFIEEKINVLIQKMNEIRTNRILKLVTQYVLPEVKIYKEKLTCNSQDFVDIFGTVQGFTGTPWNAPTFHERLQAGTKESQKDTKGTDGKTANILWQNSRKDIHNMTSLQYPKALNEILQTCLKADANAIIDTSSFFTGVANEEVADDILAKLPSKYEAVVYFDENNEIVVKEKGKATAIPLKESRFKNTPEKYFTYYDQRHTTGTDIKQPPLARAVVTIGDDLTMRDLFQGVWRLRGLDKSQKVIFALSPQAEKNIRSTLALPRPYVGRGPIPARERDVALPITFENILSFVFQNQVKQQKEHLILSTTQKITHVLKQAVIDRLREINFSDTSQSDQIAKFIEEIKSILVTKIEDNPFVAFGDKETQLDTNIVIKKLLDEVLAKVDMLPETSMLFKGNKAAFRKQILEQAEKVVHKELLPPQLSSKLVNRKDADQSEVMAQEETQTQAKTETQMQTRTEQRYNSEAFHSPFLHWATKDQPYPAIFTNKFWNHSIRNIDPSKVGDGYIPTPKVKDYLEQQTHLKEFANIFDDELLATCNFLPLNGKIFSQQQLPSQHLAVIKEGEEFKITFLDHGGDVGFFYDALTAHRHTNKDQNEDLDLYLYDITHDAIVQHSKKALLSKEALKKNEKLQRLLVQAKVYMGFIHYSAQEQQILIKWIQEKGVARFENLVKKILPFHPRENALFEHSTLKQVIKSLNSK